MKKLFIVANWKSNKTADESIAWLHRISNFQFPISNDVEREIIICPSFTLLPSMKAFITENNLPIKLGAQNVSSYDEGAYTGEANAKQIKEFADYVLIGHSERRKEFKEDDETLTKKVQMALKYGLTPIFCVLDEQTFIPDDVTIVAYELASAIGTGTPDSPESAEKIAKIVEEKHPSIQYALYGASVTPENVQGFTSLDDIHGVLVGGASLDVHKFLQIIENA